MIFPKAHDIQSNAGIPIAQEDSDTRADIEKLKIELRDAEELREQKREYDVIAERINALPHRSDLDASVPSILLIPIHPSHLFHHR